ncbi:SMI1/KNR4 family protein [Flavobacterium reichenbachii]|uniref:Glucan synthesis regulatory protein n=1 Tax=Flavobacterium reichenbachii TaxID=362418 RepID=A0A085ZJ44_9FLAO|nr:SMI1/KNR4 family protein [Flavobacterium reichenbachii]KFF04458.1 glucan synthesis regulatory protein [Flavobacterium reichenbachii]OXB14434.1 transcriptional regulator [Flavobacterium reichenbachii]
MTVNKVIATFKNKLDIFETLMNKGLKDFEIDDFQKYVKQDLPSEYIELLKNYNGEKHILCCMAGFGFSNIEQVKINWDSFNNEEQNNRPEKIFQKHKITPLLFSDKRIPFAHDGSGNFLCIDYIPNFSGKTGQIIYLPQGEPEPISVIADSFNDFLLFLIASIKNESLKLVDEREDWDQEDWHMADLYFYKTWKNDWTDIADNYNQNHQ